MKLDMARSHWSKDMISLMLFSASEISRREGERGLELHTLSFSNASLTGLPESNGRKGRPGLRGVNHCGLWRKLALLLMASSQNIPSGWRSVYCMGDSSFEEESEV